jgi:hypothetical protein
MPAPYLRKTKVSLSERGPQGLSFLTSCPDTWSGGPRVCVVRLHKWRSLCGIASTSKEPYWVQSSMERSGRGCNKLAVVRSLVKENGNGEKLQGRPSGARSKARQFDRTASFSDSLIGGAVLPDRLAIRWDRRRWRAERAGSLRAKMSKSASHVLARPNLDHDSPYKPCSAS